MIHKFRELVGRASLIEVAIAFAIALALENLISTIVNGVIRSPIQDSHDASWSYLAFDVAGRTFTFLLILLAALTRAAVVAIARWFSRRSADRLWDAEPGVECRTACRRSPQQRVCARTAPATFASGRPRGLARA